MQIVHEICVAFHIYYTIIIRNQKWGNNVYTQPIDTFSRRLYNNGLESNTIMCVSSPGVLCDVSAEHKTDDKRKTATESTNLSANKTQYTHFPFDSERMRATLL